MAHVQKAASDNGVLTESLRTMTRELDEPTVEETTRVVTVPVSVLETPAPTSAPTLEEGKEGSASSLSIVGEARGDGGSSLNNERRSESACNSTCIIGAAVGGGIVLLVIVVLLLATTQRNGTRKSAAVTDAEKAKKTVGKNKAPLRTGELEVTMAAVPPKTGA